MHEAKRARREVDGGMHQRIRRIMSAFCFCYHGKALIAQREWSVERELLVKAERVVNGFFAFASRVLTEDKPGGCAAMCAILHDYLVQFKKWETMDVTNLVALRKARMLAALGDIACWEEEETRSVPKLREWEKDIMPCRNEMANVWKRRAALEEFDWDVSRLSRDELMRFGGDYLRKTRNPTMLELARRMEVYGMCKYQMEHEMMVDPDFAKRLTQVVLGFWTRELTNG
jgi:hypothetical protein